MCITGIEPWLASASHDNLGLPCVDPTTLSLHCAVPTMLAHTSTSLLAVTRQSRLASMLLYNH